MSIHFGTGGNIKALLGRGEPSRGLRSSLSEEECACPKIRPHLEQLIREQLKDIATKIDQFALLKKELEGFPESRPRC